VIVESHAEPQSSQREGLTTEHTEIAEGAAMSAN
jgi:hypothetical protein